MATPQEHFNAARQYQEYYDQALCNIGVRAPAPVLSQKVNDYRRETLRQLKHSYLPQNHPLYKVQMRGLPDEAIPAIEPQVLTDAVKEAKNPANFHPGEIHLVPWTDPQTGRKENHFYGEESFVKNMMRPGRRVIGFRTPHGLEMTKS